MNPALLLEISYPFAGFKGALLSFISSFVTALLAIPPIITLIHRYRLFDMPNGRKEHQQPVPTMGGIAIVAGMMMALVLWFPFRYEVAQIAFFFSVCVLFGLGIMDDLKDLSAKYKFLIQFGLALLIALSGIRIQNFDGLFGIYQLPLLAQYLFTILAVVGITNAFNLIDGIDGLAGGLGFMSIITLGLFLSIAGDSNTALIAFALAGALLAFLYFNFNPASIFMGDTGSLVVGFVIAVLSVRLMQINPVEGKSILAHAPLFALGIVLIPVFDTLRVFATRMWYGKSPFVADRIHIHHLLTNQGFGHSFASRVICSLHGIVLLASYLLNSWTPELILCVQLLAMFGMTWLLKRMGKLVPLQPRELAGNP